ncbi:MAG: LOG family protein [bacterium]|nr:LOG family protein [bacterium]
MKRAPKAYKNPDFLHSGDARLIRILAEYEEPRIRFEKENIKHSVVFFGSARVRPGETKSSCNTGKYYEAAEEFAFQLASWSNTLTNRGESFVICSGGGPGIMEAANKGAQRANAPNIGLNISLPHEQEPNDYISPSLNFEFHYFFMRKLWFLYHAKALVVFPGGFGTMDELFETLTLVQTQKLHTTGLTIPLYDQSFWEGLINFKKLADCGLISPNDLNLFHYFNSPEEGMTYLKPRLKKIIKDFNNT